MTQHSDDHDHANHPGNHPLTELQLTYSRLPAQLTLARLRGDAGEMDMIIEYASEQLGIKQMIGSLVTELAALMANAHGSTEAAEQVLQETLLRMAAGKL